MGSPLVDFPQLVDLAVGTPESGAVNFNVLHALLHAIIQVLNVEEVRVELVDTPICKPDIPLPGIGQRQMTVEEYKIEKKGKRTLIERPPSDVEKVILVRKSAKDEQSETVDSARTEPSNSPRKLTTLLKGSPPVTSSKMQTVSEPSQQQTVPDLAPLMDVIHRMETVEDKMSEMEESLAELRQKWDNLGIDHLEGKIYDQKSESRLKEEKRPPSSHGKSPPPSPSVVYDKSQIQPIQEEIRHLKNEIEQIKLSLKEEHYETNKTKPSKVRGASPQSPGSKGRRLSPASSGRRRSEDDCYEAISTMNHKLEVLSSKFLTLNDQMLEIERELCELAERFENVGEGKDVKASLGNITDFHVELAAIKSYIENIVRESNHLMSEQQETSRQVNKLGKGFEDLVASKVGKEDIDELLAEKADYNMLQRKVSVDYFDASKRDLENTIVKTISRMQELEESWCNKIEDIHKKIEKKLNASEVTALKENIDRKLQMMADRMSALCTNKKGPEAAGARIKLIKDLNCISCNQHVLMRAEELNKLPEMKSMPGHKSIKPFLTYELDNLRKQIKDIPGSRNMHHFEAILKDKGLVMDEKVRQVCKRYCGGSHTIITPQDRVGRGRCGKLYGARNTTMKCICAEPSPPPCTCPDEEPEEEICPCPEEPEDCSCPSEDDPFQKCLSAHEKRCLEIDRERRERCKVEEDARRRQCKEEMEKHQKWKEEKERREKCRSESDKREKCLPEIQMRDRCALEMEKRERCKTALEKYTICKQQVQSHDRSKSALKRVSLDDNQCFNERKDSSRRENIRTRSPILRKHFVDRREERELSSPERPEYRETLLESEVKTSDDFAVPNFEPPEHASELESTSSNIGKTSFDKAADIELSPDRKSEPAINEAQAEPQKKSPKIPNDGVDDARVSENIRAAKKGDDDGDLEENQTEVEEEAFLE